MQLNTSGRVPLQSLMPAEIRDKGSPSFRNRLAFKNVALGDRCKKKDIRISRIDEMIQAGLSGKCRNPLPLEGLGQPVGPFSAQLPGERGERGLEPAPSTAPSAPRPGGVPAGSEGIRRGLGRGVKAPVAGRRCGDPPHGVSGDRRIRRPRRGARPGLPRPEPRGHRRQGLPAASRSLVLPRAVPCPREPRNGAGEGPARLSQTELFSLGHPSDTDRGQLAPNQVMGA